MKVYFINIDNKFPFLLAQLRTYHQSIGDIITDDDPDLIYISCIFQENISKARSAASFYPHAKVVIGGPAVSDNSYPVEDIARTMPDYDAFGIKESYARTTIGCNNKCWFCVVPTCEGKQKRVAKIEDTHNKKHDTIHVFDNNWIQDKEWFMENSQYLIDQKLNVIEHGIDVRLIDEEIATQLSKIKFSGYLHFAWDFTQHENKVFNGIEILSQNGIKPYRMIFYTIGVNDLDDLSYRCDRLIEHGIDPYVMLYEKKDQSPTMKLYQRFINGHGFRNYTFAEFCDHEKHRSIEHRCEMQLSTFA